MNQDLHHVFKAFTQIEKINLVGLSWGAILATDFALEYPERVEKLILLSPGLSGWDYFQDKDSERNFQLRQQAKQAAELSAAMIDGLWLRAVLSKSDKNQFKHSETLAKSYVNSLIKQYGA